MAVYAKYGLPVKNSNSTEMTNSDDDKRTYFPNGAITHYYAPMPYGYKPTELTTTYYSQSDTKDYLLSGAGFSIESTIEAQSPAIPRPKRSRCRSSQEVNDSPTPFSALNYCLPALPIASMSLS